MKSFSFFVVLFASLNVHAVTFNKKDVWVDGNRLKVEIAETPAQHEQGLMNRKSVPEGEGMLFVFPQKKILSFWMKNTLVPLTVGFFSEEGILLETVDMMPAIAGERSLRTYESERESKYALEVPKGWFKKKKIKKEAKLLFEKP